MSGNIPFDLALTINFAPVSLLPNYKPYQKGCDNEINEVSELPGQLKKLVHG